MRINALLNTVLNDLHDLKALDVLPLDVQNMTTITDYMVIATGNSGRHVRSLVENLINQMKARDITPLHVEGDPQNEWLLVDFGDIIVHVMQASTRDFYQLEKLWSQSQTQLALA